MTWGRATPVLVLCIIFDALRFLFDMFWFFGPAMAAILCTAGVNSAIGTSVGGVVGNTVAAGCTAAAATAGFFGAVPIEIFGTIMAMAVGLIGWLTIFLVQVMRNIGIFKTHFVIKLVISRLVSLIWSEIPIINALPALTIVNVTLFHHQIKEGREALKKWEEENSAQLAQEQRQQQAAELMQVQQAQAASADVY